MQNSNNPKYIRRDIEGGFLFDDFEINCFKQNQIEDILNNYLLGDFNSEGNYILDKSIINELINLKKVYDRSFADLKFCHSITHFENIGNIQFAIDFSFDADINAVTAVLVLLEPVQSVNGYMVNTNGVSIAKFVGVDDKDFTKRCFQYFNVLMPDELDGAVLEENQEEENFREILSRILYVKSVKSIADPFLQRLDKETFKRKLNALESDKLVGKNIIDEFNEEVTSIKDYFLDKNSADYYKNLNKILDRTIEKNREVVNKYSSLKDEIRKVENFKKENSLLVTEKSTKVAVQNKLTQFANLNLSKQTLNKNSKGICPIAVYREEQVVKKEKLIQASKKQIKTMNKETVKKEPAKIINKIIEKIKPASAFVTKATEIIKNGNTVFATKPKSQENEKGEKQVQKPKTENKIEKKSTAEVKNEKTSVKNDGLNNKNVDNKTVENKELGSYKNLKTEEEKQKFYEKLNQQNKENLLNQINKEHKPNQESIDERYNNNINSYFTNSNPNSNANNVTSNKPSEATKPMTFGKPEKKGGKKVESSIGNFETYEDEKFIKNIEGEAVETSKKGAEETKESKVEIKNNIPQKKSNEEILQQIFGSKTGADLSMKKNTHYVNNSLESKNSNDIYQIKSSAKAGKKEPNNEEELKEENVFEFTNK